MNGHPHRPRIRGGVLTAVVVIAVFLVDLAISRSFPQLKDWECCAPNEHVGDLIAASGVAVAFVLTYLAALTGLPSPGRQLLASALSHIKNLDPELAAIDEDGRISQNEYRLLQEFLDDAQDLGKNDEAVLTATTLFSLIIALAKPSHIRPNPTIEQLESLGYAHFRANFLSSIVFKRDAEKRMLLRATILCAIIFGYTSVVYCLEFLRLMDSSVAMLIGYPLLAAIGFGFATAMGMRMWPHTVEYDVIGAIIPPMEAARQRTIARDIRSLDDVVDAAEAATRAGALTSSTVPLAEIPVSPEMIEQAERHLDREEHEKIEKAFRAMFTEGFRQGLLAHRLQNRSE
jgi:hypothetical protein